MSEHTPTPWEVGSGDDYYIRAEAYPKAFPHRFKNDDLGDYLALVGNRTKDFGEANAAFIVKAVNSHDALVKALQAALAIAELEWFFPGAHPHRAAVVNEMVAALATAGIATDVGGGAKP